MACMRSWECWTVRQGHGGADRAGTPEPPCQDSPIKVSIFSFFDGAKLNMHRNNTAFIRANVIYYKYCNLRGLCRSRCRVLLNVCDDGCLQCCAIKVNSMLPYNASVTESIRSALTKHLSFTHTDSLWHTVTHTAQTRVQDMCCTKACFCHTQEFVMGTVLRRYVIAH